MNGWMKLAAAFFAAASLTGCSLLKVAVATGDPLSKEEMNVRTMTRGFYYDMAGEVARAADSIASLSPDVNTRVAAVRWKIRATRAGVNAAMQGIPDVALADMWILCRRMNDAFSAAPDSLLFGPRSGIARDAVRRLDLRAGRLARQVLPSDRYDLMASFVEEYVRKNPASEGDETDNTTLAWLEYLRDNGVEHAYATGSIAEVLADVNDRLSGQTRQMSNSIGWSKDIFEMRLEQDSLRLQVGAQLDSLERSFNRIVVVAEHVPEISDRVLEELNRQVTGRIATYNFAPTRLSKQNLMREDVSPDSILVTGNTVIDALRQVVRKIKTDAELDKELEGVLLRSGYDVNRLVEGKRLVLITGHRRENFGDGFIHMCTAIKDLTRKYPEVDFVYPMHLNPNVRKPIHEVFGEDLSHLENMFFIEPLEYLSFVYLMEKSTIVLTDSGGIQEEAPGLGKPVLVMRDTTERPEALAAGTVKLVGTDYDKIVSEVSALLDDTVYYDAMSKAVNPYGDGLACGRIVEFLNQRK